MGYNIQKGLQSIADLAMEQVGVSKEPNKLQKLNVGLGGTAKGGGLGSFGGVGAIGGDLLAGFGSMLGNNYGEDFSDEQKATQSTIRKGLAMIPGYGQIIAAATGAIDAIGTATGMNLSNIDKNAAERAGIGGSAKFNNIMNSIPGVSMLMGGIWAGKRTNAYNMSDEAEEMASGYGGTVNDLRAASDLANKRILFGKDKTNAFIDSAKKNDELLTQINETNTMRKQSNYYQDLAHQNINRYAGQNYLGTRVGRTGLKLMNIEEVRAILSKKQETQKLQNGGIVGIDSSVMPVGALHKELHHIEDNNPELAEEITRKGIPVVSISENGKIEQIAEVERDELILSKSITDEVERLREMGDDLATIECGKLIASELITNTNDPNNIIENA